MNFLDRWYFDMAAPTQFGDVLVIVFLLVVGFVVYEIAKEYGPHDDDEDF